jgi:hypothetical protein
MNATKLIYRNIVEKPRKEIRRNLYIAVIATALMAQFTTGFSQNVGISSTGATPHTSAGLDINFPNKGLLIPRVNLLSNTDAVTITTPANSLLVYNTNASMTSGSIGYWYWDGAKWVKLLSSASAAAWTILGNAGTTRGTHFFGTTDSAGLSLRTNNISAINIDSLQKVGIGTNSPTNTLHVFGNVNPVRIQGLQGGIPSDSVLTVDGTGVVHMRDATIFGGGVPGWTLTGNSGRVDGTDFIGTTDNVPFSIRVNNSQSGRLDNTLNNAFYGYQAGNVNTTGSNNIFMGSYAGLTNTTGRNNLMIGFNAGQSNTTGEDNLMIGFQTGYFNTASANHFVGNFAGFSNTTGADNTANGFQSLYANTTGGGNTATGSLSLKQNTTGAGNTATGSYALYSNTTGASNTTINYYEKSGVNAFSRSTLSSPTDALPVTFLLFNASCTGDYVSLTWKTAREVNTKNFLVEVSQDGFVWRPITSVSAKGTSDNGHMYTFVNNSLASTNSFYRIVAYDINNRKTVSSVIKSGCGVIEDFKIWPNPVNSLANVSIRSIQFAQAKLTLYDSKGLLLQTQQSKILPGNNQLQINMSHLLQGTYLLYVTWGTTSKMIKLNKL